MSAVPATQDYREVSRPGPRTKLVAILVILALAGLALYAVYAPPTRVALPGGGHAQPVRTVPAVPQGEPEGEGGEGGD